LFLGEPLQTGFSEGLKAIMDKEYKRKHYIENKEKYKENQKRWLEKNSKYYKEYKGGWYRDNATRLKDYRLKQRTIVYRHYGNKCACCGEDNIKFLSIDHVNNDGHNERKSRGGSSDQIIRRIILNNFPDTYQVLCFNCNLGKSRNGGICPHID
jgi:hypothetical protein